MGVRKSKLYSEHSRSWQTNRYVYPVISRRSGGLSIGVNLNPDKVCNFDCIYCCVDRTTPAADSDVDMDVLRAELDHMLRLVRGGEIFGVPPFDQTPEPLRRMNDVAFSGDGEPTSFRQFPEACRLAAELLEAHRLGSARIVVITNATLLHRPNVAEALAFLDTHNGEIWAKLDAGSEAYYRFIERASIPFQRVLDNIAAAGAVRPIVIQSLFMQVNGQPPSPGEIDQYIDRLGDLVAAGCRIRLVQVYTVARATAESFVTPLPDDAVDAIADRVRAAGLTAKAYYGPG